MKTSAPASLQSKNRHVSFHETTRATRRKRKRIPQVKKKRKRKEKRTRTKKRKTNAVTTMTTRNPTMTSTSDRSEVLQIISFKSAQQPRVRESG